VRYTISHVVDIKHKPVEAPIASNTQHTVDKIRNTDIVNIIHFMYAISFLGFI